MKQDGAEVQHLLVVEDDADLSEMLTNFFRVIGYQVTPAFTGEDALALAARERPDLVLLDIRLPDINGYQICRRLREQRHTQDVPVIFLTERRERKSKLAGLELGAVDYVTKPFDVQELRLRVRNALLRAQQPPLANGITGLPEGTIVRERLERMLELGRWGLVVAGLQGLDDFRDHYGFVAADDAVRAVGVMLKNSLQATGDEFIGHLGPTDFALVTTPNRLETLAEHCEMQLREAMHLFYPALERPAAADASRGDQLHVTVHGFSSRDHHFATLRELQDVLYPIVD
jgi:PleD family two-component response regulator